MVAYMTSPFVSFYACSLTHTHIYTLIILYVLDPVLYMVGLDYIYYIYISPVKLAVCKWKDLSSLPWSLWVWAVKATEYCWSKQKLTHGNSYLLPINFSFLFYVLSNWKIATFRYEIQRMCAKTTPIKLWGIETV